VKVHLLHFFCKVLKFLKITISTKSPPRKRVTCQSGHLSQKDDHDPSQENIFCTRYNIFENTRFAIMNSGSSSNCCSTRLVEKLNLAMLPYPKHYKLYGLHEDGDIIIKNQVKIQFSIGKYKDEVLYDIVPMNNCHILLGRLWHFDRQVIHNGLSNKITFYQKKKKFVFHPLTPTQVAADQVQMKINRERDQKEKEEKERRDIEEMKEHEKTIREKEEREKEELEKMTKEEEEILIKKGRVTDDTSHSNLYFC